MDTTGFHNQKRLPENIMKQLALAVRRIQWSYAIFWSTSAVQTGALEWGDGYYNGDIKTRKTVQSVEINADQLGLQRSEQLRELYESLSAGESSPQPRRPSAALSPEDLSETEWYYLVCMSFVFNIGQGLPGRTLANGQPIWLCNANYADSKVFSRSLLAKSASIQTVVCIPFLRGVIELGITEQVLEDPSLIQDIRTSFLESPCSVAANSGTSDKELPCTAFRHEIPEVKLVPAAGCEELDIASPDDSLDNQVAEDSIMVEGINGGASQVQSWHFMDDDFSNCVHHSMNSSDCMSQTIVDPVKVVPAPKSNDEKVNEHCLQDVKDCNHTKLTALDLRNDDLHYQSVLSYLLKTSNTLILGPNVPNSHWESSFVSWQKGGLMVQSPNSKCGTPQMLLKKILFQVPQMHTGSLPSSPDDNSNNKVGAWRPEGDEIGSSHVLSERKQSEKINKRFMILRSLVPSISKVDKASILDDTIEYLQKLERRVQELESRRELTEVQARTKRKPQDAPERTSDNYGSNKIGNGQEPFTNKRKASEINEIEQGMDHNLSKDGSADNVTFTMNDEDVLIEMNCPWRDGILLEVMDALSHFSLDSHSVQSTTIDGMLSLTIKSKHKGLLTAASTGAVKKALQRTAWKCQNLFSQQ